MTGVASLLLAGLVVAADLPMQTSLPTAELDEHYLGVKKLDSYTFAMLELGIRLGAAVEASLGDGGDHAAAAVARFREQYQTVRDLVPAWRSHFSVKAIDELEAAVAKGADRATVRRLVDVVERDCTACHVQYMVPVQARYRWGRFAEINVDGDSGRSLDFHTIMVDLSNGLGALRGDVERGNVAAATAHYERVKERFTMMELACSACHEEPREYFIDARVKARLLKIGGLLRKGASDPAVYSSELNGIYELSCLPCHQVHMPAAFLQQYWAAAGR
jgi:cytochrome c556